MAATLISWFTGETSLYTKPVENLSLQEVSAEIQSLKPENVQGEKQENRMIALIQRVNDAAHVLLHPQFSESVKTLAGRLTSQENLERAYPHLWRFITQPPPPISNNLNNGSKLPSKVTDLANKGDNLNAREEAEAKAKALLVESNAAACYLLDPSLYRAIMKISFNSHGRERIQAKTENCTHVLKLADNVCDTGTPLPPQAQENREVLPPAQQEDPRDAQIRTLQAQNQQLQTENTQLKEQNAELETLRQETENTQLKEQNAELETLRQENERFRKQVEQLKELEKFRNVKKAWDEFQNATKGVSNEDLEKQGAPRLAQTIRALRTTISGAFNNNKVK